ncbi:hypothetical protein Q5752_000781 [Cryptotrichosporon argae]
MSNFLDQAKSAASAAINTASNLATQAASTASGLANQAAASETGAKLADQAKALGAQAGSAAASAAEGAKTLAGQAHAQAHAYAPGVVPPPASAGATAAGVDTTGDLSPTNEKDKEKLEALFGSRASAAELQNRNILKGDPNDALAGKRADLQKSMLENKLDTELAQRPAAEELVKKGILSPDEAPPA